MSLPKVLSEDEETKVEQRISKTLFLSLEDVTERYDKQGVQ